jgi:hypothetical protein
MSLSHAFSKRFAEIYGVECAIIISHFQFWIEQNQAMNRNFHDGRTWMYQTQKEIAAVYSYWSEDAVARILKKLEEYEVIIKGDYNKSNFDKTTWYAFKNEEMFTKPRNRGIADNECETVKVEKKPLQDGLADTAKSRNRDRGIATPIPDTMPKQILDIEGNDKTMPFRSSNEDNAKFPLKKEQIPLFDALCALELGASDGTLFVLIRTNSQQKLLDAINHMKIEIERGTTFRKGRIAFFRHLLKGDVSIISERASKNKSWAQKAKEKGQWSSLSIFDKYCICEKTGKEISLDLDNKEFAEQLYSMFELSKNY